MSGSLLNGALIAMGALGIFDTVLVHWILQWHRLIEGSPYNLQMEIGVIAVSAVLLAVGLRRELRGRKAGGAGH
ncbi:MAG TPA: hypothetical protein VM489_18400 [Burkholderiales bacterium]|nr:hypothetical protein [Burkholderiales bacterium]